MSHIHTEIDFNARRATRRFVDLCWSMCGRLSEMAAQPVAQNAPPCNDQIGGATQSKLSLEAKRAANSSKNRATPSQAAWTGNDMSASSATLTLMLLATVAAVHSDHPTFWLSIGPAPVAAGLVAFTLFRRKYGRNQRTTRTGDLPT